MNAVVLESVLTCPQCGFAAQQEMPTDAYQFFYEYRNCKTLLRPKPTTGGVIVHAAAELDADAIAAVATCVRQRLLQSFVRRHLLSGDDSRAMRQWQHGGGFSIDASVRIEAADCAGRERLLRYCARPPLALERLRELDPNRLVYDSPKPGPGAPGTLMLTPLELLDRLAALVSPPRIHRHFGVLARTAAHWTFPRRPRTAGFGRLFAFAIEPES